MYYAIQGKRTPKGKWENILDGFGRPYLFLHRSSAKCKVSCLVDYVDWTIRVVKVDVTLRLPQTIDALKGGSDVQLEI